MAAQSPTAPASPLRNWSGNLTFEPAHVARPTTLAELSTLLAASSRVKALGSAHSFSSIAQVDDRTTLVLLDALELGPPQLTPTAEGGATISLPASWTYSQLAAYLSGTPWALANMASLPHISIGGTIATATHGSGARNSNLASAVRGLEFVTADGSLLACDERSPRWPAHVVHLGALGIVTHVTLALVPAFDIQQNVYLGVTWAEGCAHLSEILAGGYSVSLFTTWSAPLQFEQVWRKTIVDVGGTSAAAAAAPADVWFGAPRATSDVHPIPGVDAAPCTPQCGVPGPWHARLPHFRAEFTPSAGAELQSEFFVAAADAPAALAALAPLAPRIAACLFITEVRAIAADVLPLSTAAGRDSVAIHFTWKFLEEEVHALLPAIEAALAPFSARPHWGKLFLADAASIAAAHGGSARLDEWRALRAEMDPSLKFGNKFLRDAGLLELPAKGTAATGPPA